MSLSFGQWIKLIAGAVALGAQHPEALARLRRFYNDDLPVLKPLINDGLDLWASISPPGAAKPGDPISHTEVIRKIANSDFTPEERAVMDRASQSFG